MLFFTSHPKYQSLLQRISQPPLDYSNQITIALKSELADTWSVVDAEWRIFVSELDFGFSPKHSSVDLGSIPLSPLTSKVIQTIRCDRGWQSTGLKLNRGQAVHIAAHGRCSIRGKQGSNEDSAWKFEPQGITLEYHQGQPLGRLLAMIVPLSEAVLDNPVHRCSSLPIGRAATLESPQSGLLLLKVNESSAGLVDNAGEFNVTIEPDAS